LAVRTQALPLWNTANILLKTVWHDWYASIVDYTLPDTGTYTIYCEDERSDDSGRYRLSIELLILTILSISPNNGVNTEVVTVTIIGKRFQKGATVKLVKTGQPDIIGTETTTVDSTKITTRFDLKGKEVGVWDVVVVNPDGGTSTLAGAFTVIEPAIIGISPDKGGNAGMATVKINGRGFKEGAIPRLRKSGENDIIGTNVIYNPTRLITTFDLTGKTPGKWDVVVENPDETLILQEGFTIEQGGEPKLWVDIVGRDQRRVGREQTYWIKYGNAGNIDRGF